MIFDTFEKWLTILLKEEYQSLLKTIWFLICNMADELVKIGGLF